MKKVLITGAFGYLGGRIAYHLASQPDLELHLGTRKERPRPDWLKNGKLVQADFGADTLPDLTSGVDTVIHLAALNEIQCGQNPVASSNVNCTGTLKLLEQCVRNNVRRIIYFSTARVYKEPLIGTVTEQDRCHPVHPYGISHKGAEDYILAASGKGEIEAVVLRLANAIGYPMEMQVDRWSLLVNDLCRSLISSKKVELRSTGLQPRNFIALEDVARAVDHFRTLPAEQVQEGIFNLAGPEFMSVWDMAQLVSRVAEQVLDQPIPLTRPEPAPGETTSELDYSIGRLLATGFTFEGNLEEEIEGTLRLCLSEESTERNPS